MIRGRKEGSTYASWFIGFDHDDTFGLPAFPELPPQSTRTPVHCKPVSRAASLESLLPVGHTRDPQSPVPSRSLTLAATQTPSQTSTQTSTQTTDEISTQTPHQVSTQTLVNTSTETSTESSGFQGAWRSRTPGHIETRPRSHDFDTERSRRRREKDTQGLYKEAFDGAKRAEEFKFRVRFDKLVGDLHLAIEEKSPNGLTTTFASPSYGEVMLTFKYKVKELLRGFTQKLQLAYENLAPIDSTENTGQKVKQNVSKFIEDLIGETLDLTSDEAISDLSSLSDDSSPDQNSFEDLIAQAVVSKLLENFHKDASETLLSSNNNLKKNELRDQGTETQNNVIARNQKDSFTSYDFSERNKNNSDTVNGKNNIYSKQQRENYLNAHNSTSLYNPDLSSIGTGLVLVDTKEESNKITVIVNDQSEKRKVNSESDKKSKANNDESHFINGIPEPSDLSIGLANTNEFSNAKVENGVPDEDTDFVKEFEQLKEFVQRTRTLLQPKVEAIPFDDSNLCEVKEETFLKTEVSRDEEREEFHTRYSVFDRVHNSQPVLSDFSQFENIDFTSDEIDPDLLSMNLEIIPEETEEELEQEEDDWNANWEFKNKRSSPYASVGKKTAEGSLYMTVPRPNNAYVPKIGNKDIDQLSDFSDHDLLGHSDFDGSDEEENTYYANTSKELARISGQHKWPSNQRRQSSQSHSDDSDYDNRLGKRKVQKVYKRNTFDFDDIDNRTNHIRGPIVEPSRQEIKLLQNLVPAENDDPKFLLSPESVVVQEGEPVKFSCRVAGTGPIDVFWYREGEDIEELEESEDVEISSNGDKHSIVLYNISKNMAGQYMCLALNEKGKASQYLTVTVKDNKQELKKPDFMKGLTDVEVTEGQSVKLRVKVKGYPPPRISWYKDGELLKNSKSCRIEKFGNRDYILTIDYASMNDDAEYTVSARNVAGEERMSAQVIVEPQSDLPVRRQRISSTSDSDSDRTISQRSLILAVGAATSEVTISSSATMQDLLHVNYLDRKVALTQKQVETEAQKMIGVAEKFLSITCTLDAVEEKLASLEITLPSLATLSKDWVESSQNIWNDLSTFNDMEHTSESQRLITADTKDILQLAEDLIQQERNVQHYSNQTLNEERLVPSSVGNTSEASRTLNPDSFIDDLALPDTLDEFPLQEQNSMKSDPFKSALELNLPGESQPDNAKFSYRDESASEKFKSEVSFHQNGSGKDVILSQPVVDPGLNQNKTDLSIAVPGSVVLLNNSATVSNSSITDTNCGDGDHIYLDISRQQDLRDKYSRDFEVQQTKEKKWSVTFHPFSPQAEVVNRQNTADKTNSVEINVTDLSPSSSIHLSKGDNSSQSSSRRQSSDSGVSVSSKQKQAPPVHMIGHTTEDEVPESRTEFNTDGSIELPSVNKLRAMFSSIQDDDVESSSLKRIHSITARNVPKEQLGKLKASNQNESSPSILLSSSRFLEVPGSSQDVSQVSATSWQMNGDPTQTVPSFSSLPPSKVNIRPVPVSKNPVPANHQKTLQISTTGAYRDLDPDKDPVLIYPETDPEYMQRHHPQQCAEERPSIKAFLPTHLNQQQVVKKTSATAPAKPSQPHQKKLIVRQVMPDDENENVKKSGPRIKSGCISARAAFWERRIVDGGAVSDEVFPEMVEDGDT